jgi:succinyl-CoA synthetase alpha subunit
MDLMKFPQLKTIAIIAEGVPEKRARQILHAAKEKGVLIIGPATVGKQPKISFLYIIFVFLTLLFYHLLSRWY